MAHARIMYSKILVTRPGKNIRYITQKMGAGLIGQHKTLRIDLYAAVLRLRLPGPEAWFFTVQIKVCSRHEIFIVSIWNFCNNVQHKVAKMNGLKTVRLHIKQNRKN